MTPWYQNALEVVGFDILLIGALFVLTIFIAQELWRLGPPFTAFANGWKMFRETFGLDTQAKEQAWSGDSGSAKKEEQPAKGSDSGKENKPGLALAVLATTKAASSGIAILLLAAAAGMTLNTVTDRFLDIGPISCQDELSGNGACQIPACETCFNKFLHHIKFAWPEDEIKREAFGSTATFWTSEWHPKLTFPPITKDHELQACKGLPKPQECRDAPEATACKDALELQACQNLEALCPGDRADVLEVLRKKRDMEHYAKELYQHAHFSVLASDKADVKNHLLREQLFVKLFRVMFVLTAFLLLCTLWSIICSVFRKKGKIWSRIGMAFLLFCVGCLFLYSWSVQSRHYYKQVYHAFGVIAGEKAKDSFNPQAVNAAAKPPAGNSGDVGEVKPADQQNAGGGKNGAGDKKGTGDRKDAGHKKDTGQKKTEDQKKPADQKTKTDRKK